jgi:hypothetical protein
MRYRALHLELHIPEPQQTFEEEASSCDACGPEKLILLFHSDSFLYFCSVEDMMQKQHVVNNTHHCDPPSVIFHNNNK